MESSEDVEVLSRALEKLLAEKRKREAAGDTFIEDDDDQLLLSRLISQLGSSPTSKINTDGTTKEEEKDDVAAADSSPSNAKGNLEGQLEEIAKDIKEVKKQNKVTHILISAMIILTLTWQLSEYSMIFILKDRITHPVRSIGGMLKGMFKGKIRPFKNQLQGTSTSKDQNNHDNENGTNTGAHLNVPDLMQEFGFNDNKE